MDSIPTTGIGKDFHPRRNLRGFPEPVYFLQVFHRWNISARAFGSGDWVATSYASLDINDTYLIYFYDARYRPPQGELVTIMQRVSLSSLHVFPL